MKGKAQKGKGDKGETAKSRRHSQASISFHVAHQPWVPLDLVVKQEQDPELLWSLRGATKKYYVLCDCHRTYSKC